MAIIQRSSLSGFGQKANERYIVEDIKELVAIANAGSGGGVLEGTQYVFVAANGNALENAAELKAAYVTAQGMSPGVKNRITVIAAPGNYNFGVAPFVMNTQYIDLVSLDGNRSIVFNSTPTEGTISITANDVFVKGVDVVSKNFTIASGLNLLKVQNCRGGDQSFGGGAGITVSGTFTNCVGGKASFGGGGTASGTFVDCVGGDSQSGNGAFAGGFGGFASGVFTNCVAGGSSFGGGAGTASGTFTNCIGGQFSFGTFLAASGTFTNCIGGQFSFGTFLAASGTFTNCQGNDSFGLYGTLTGKLYYCRLTSGSFQTVTSPGVTRLCIDGNNVENNQG